jgi:alkaline phosphatase
MPNMSRLIPALMASVCVLAACATPVAGTAGPAREAVAPVQSADSYYTKAQAAVSGRLGAEAMPRAKNVILFVGDGMGVSTITAGRIYAGQAKGKDGESNLLAMESLPHSAMVRNYTHDSQVADSAPTAAAMTTGVKSYNGTIGVTQAAQLNDCTSAARATTDSLWEIAEKAGLSTGVVSTARLTHATPAATFAKTVERDWESDRDISAVGKAAGCVDIAAQFMTWQTSVGDGFEVALGGGRSYFLPDTAVDAEYPNIKGNRKDGRDMMAEWAALPGHASIQDAKGFAATNFDSDVKVLGLFEPSHMRYELDRAKDVAGEPSLTDMTRAAITRLSRNENGYVLMVEGGRIDHAHHAGNAARALGDTQALDEAVAAALAMTDPAETLIIVTADHSHTFVIQGYPGRNNPILGLAADPVTGAALIAGDGKPYTTLSYANGPGAVCRGTTGCERPNLKGVDTTAIDFLQQSLLPMGSETHGGEDVALFASGPGSSLFTGSIEQNEIFHVMARSLGLAK